MTSPNPSRRERIRWLDYAKGIGIFLVVFGHALRGLVSSSILQSSAAVTALDKWIYAFHMPLFFFLAGLFIERSASKPLKDFVVDKLRVVAYPYIVWSLLQGVLQVAGSKYTHSKTSFADLWQIAYNPIMQFWFLYVLFMIMVIYGLAHKIGISPLLFLAISIVFYYLQGQMGLGSWGVLYQIRLYIIYLPLGAVVGSSLELSKWQHLRTPILILIMLASFLAVGVAVAFNLTDNLYILPVFALCGIAGSVALAILLEKLDFAHFVEQWGLLSLQIFVAHTIASSLLRIVLQKAFRLQEPIAHLILATAIGIYAPIALEAICQKVGFPYLFTLRSSSNKPSPTLPSSSHS